ncbi:MAG: hypothetical protein IPI58_02410 [Alphaproteobacteria bacterium]|nr:MAG: hypothetical protein IPI58_02410 [Alphaproteobacteria bacterium]
MSNESQESAKLDLESPLNTGTSREVSESMIGVFLPEAGLRDFIWHEPVIRRLAAEDPSGKVTLLTGDVSAARRILEPEDLVDCFVELSAEILSADLTTPEKLPSVFFTLVAMMRKLSFEKVFIFSDQAIFAAATRFAGGGNVHIYGYSRKIGLAGFFLNNPLQFAEDTRIMRPMNRAALLLESLDINCHNPHPDLKVPSQDVQILQERFSHIREPWISFGITGVEDPWPPTRFAYILDMLWERGYRGLFLTSSFPASEIGQQIMESCSIAEPQMAFGLSSGQIKALFNSSLLFFGHADSVMADLACAVGTQCAVLAKNPGYQAPSPLQLVISPELGTSTTQESGLQAISITQVMEVLRRLLPLIDLTANRGG